MCERSLVVTCLGASAIAAVCLHFLCSTRLAVLDARVNASVNVSETVVSGVRRPLPVFRTCPPAVHAGVDRMRIMLA